MRQSRKVTTGFENSEVSGIGIPNESHSCGEAAGEANDGAEVRNKEKGIQPRDCIDVSVKMTREEQQTQHILT